MVSTESLFKIIVFTVLINLPSVIYAQEVNTLSVTQAGPIAGDYQIFGAEFGPNQTDTIVGMLAIAHDSVGISNDACSPILNSIFGKVAIIEIGGVCAFQPKVLNAQEAGAVAVIICQSNDDSDLYEMSSSPGLASPNIFSGMMSKLDCDRLKMELENNDVNIVLSYVKPFCELEVTDLTVWGRNGEGTFDCGLGDWLTEGQVDGQNVVSHTIDGSSLDTVFTNTNIQIDSPTACNGATIMDFFTLTSGNDPDFDINQTNWPSYNGHLISPQIDLTNVDYPQIKFYHRAYVENYWADSLFFSHSIDDGIAWSDYNLIKSEALTFADIIPSTELDSFYIPEIANQAAVRIRFSGLNQVRYFWFIDDVTIEGLESDPISQVKTGDDLSGIKVFPNPATDQISIELRSSMGGIKNLQIVDLLGNIKMNYGALNGSQHKLEVSSIASGLYLIVLELDGQKVNHKIFIE